MVDYTYEQIAKIKREAYDKGFNDGYEYREKEDKEQKKEIS